MRELERGPKVLVSGRVMDAVTGAPVAGIEVLGLPRGKDIPWMKPARTDVEGRFTLSLPAGVSYAFCLRSRGISVVTPRADDPGYVDIETEPGMDISGIRLKFFREEFERH